MNMRTPLSKVRGFGSAKSGTEHFWRQRVTAVANVPLVIASLILIVSLAGHDHAGVTSKLGTPFVAILMMLAVLSIVAHMRIGMQVVIEDYIHHEGWKIILLILNGFYCALVVVVSIFALLKISLGA